MQQQPPGRLGRGAVGHLVEAHQQRRLVPAGRGDGQRGPGRGGAGRALDPGRRTGEEPALGLVGTHLDGHLPARAVRFADAPDHDLDGVRPVHPAHGLRLVPLDFSVPLVHVDEVDAGSTAARQRRDDGAEGGGRATVAAEHLAQVVRVYPYLQQRPPLRVLVADRDVVRVVDDPSHQVLQRVGEHAQASSFFASASPWAASAVSAASAAPSGVSTAGTRAACSAVVASVVAVVATSGVPSAVASAVTWAEGSTLSTGAVPAALSALSALSALGSRAGLVALFFAARLVTASALGSLAASFRASLKISSLSRLGSATRSVPSAFLYPLNFCQSPVIFRIWATASEG